MQRTLPLPRLNGFAEALNHVRLAQYAALSCQGHQKAARMWFPSLLPYYSPDQVLTANRAARAPPLVTSVTTVSPSAKTVAALKPGGYVSASASPWQPPVEVLLAAAFSATFWKMESRRFAVRLFGRIQKR